MSRRELCIRVRQRLMPECRVTLDQAGKIVDCVIDGIMESVVRDGRFQLLDFGTFKVKERPARKGVNPRTGEPMDIPARKVVAFKPSARFLLRFQNGPFSAERR